MDTSTTSLIEKQKQLRQAKYLKRLRKDFDDSDISKISLTFIGLGEFPFLLTFGILFLIYSMDYNSESVISICGSIVNWTFILGIFYISFAFLIVLIILIALIYRFFALRESVKVKLLKAYEILNISNKILYSLVNLLFLITISIFYFKTNKKDIIILAACKTIYNVTLSWIIILYSIIGLIIISFIIFIACICC